MSKWLNIWHFHYPFFESSLCLSVKIIWIFFTELPRLVKQCRKYTALRINSALSPLMEKFNGFFSVNGVSLSLPTTLIYKCVLYEICLSDAWCTYMKAKKEVYDNWIGVSHGSPRITTYFSLCYTVSFHVRSFTIFAIARASSFN